MVEPFVKYLTDRASLTAADLAKIDAVTVYKKLKRRQYLLHEGQVCQYHGFVVSGLLRLFRVGADATEHILRFTGENWWVSDYESFQSGLPAKGAIDALEDSQLLLWSKDNWEMLRREIPAFDALQTQLMGRAIAAQADRLHMAISSTAEEKYQVFLRSFPDFHNRVPLHMVASYLGLSRETLSRVRKHHELH
ncbi:Crp/Fnr family transcriptional regulator [Hymenobacter volaticus]|uniref:Crp/Fnr family transcriptional regulator n=1 Tax=Hymenobacter volaticus TaxID=2932254 RepID=A0ABY4GEC5_9BACT|nr:Crp/Fnr family transcriptional regulator [Hymenobacter volaticus]UOQ69276.1 Crp/Fnr family transcriptional regulator [Hymenobacter volaticus]